MTQQEHPRYLEAAPERADAAPTAVDATQAQTAEATLNVAAAPLLDLLRSLTTEKFFAVQAETHLRAELNRTVWNALVAKAEELGLTVVQPEKEGAQLPFNPTNTVEFADKTVVALNISRGELTVFVKHPGRENLYALAKSYIR